MESQLQKTLEVPQSMRNGSAIHSEDGKKRAKRPASPIEEGPESVSPACGATGIEALGLTGGWALLGSDPAIAGPA